MSGTTLSYFANFTNLNEGNYTYFVYANDTAGNFNSTVNRNFIVDYTKPTIAFVSPADADNTTVGLLRNYTYVNFTILNTNSPVDSVIVNWNGTNVTVDDPSLVLSLDFNNNTNDRSRYGNNGIQANGTNCSSTVAGKFGGACLFDGTDDTVTFGNDIDFPLNFTFMAWINIKSGAGLSNTVTRDIITKGNQIEIGVWGNNTIDCYAGTITYPPTVLANNTWNHIACTLEGNTKKIFVNGVLDFQASETLASQDNINLSIGSYYAGTSNFWNGSIDEVRIWNRSLSAAEINASYQAELGKISGTTLSYFANFTNLAEGNYTYFVWMNDTAGNFNSTVNRNFITDYTSPNITFISPTPANNSFLNTNGVYINTSSNDSSNNDYSAFIDFNRSLVGWWRFEEGTGTVVNDTSTYLNNGTMLNFACTAENCNELSGRTSAGKRGRGINFDGQNDYIFIADSDNLDLVSNLSFSAWIRPVNVDASVRTIITKRSGGTANYNIHLKNQKLTFWSGGQSEVFGNSVIQNNTWYHVTVTVDNNSSGKVRFYLNGVLDGTQTSALSAANAFNLFIGSTTGTSEFFNGTIDEVQLWNRVLNETEINASFNAGKYRLENNYTGLADGNYSYRAYAVDRAGNMVTTGVQNFTVDTVIPNATLIAPSPANNTFINTNWFYINTSTNDTNELSSLVDFNRSLVGWWRFEEG
ncbi:LamG domain-containing protein, partial [Candidatus Woesearchaeota archaeon]|nr:LamG domain-containing protein [Candidatus Woesearchaeota archaeon]